jgi:hypothetical protein
MDQVGDSTVHSVAAAMENITQLVGAIPKPPENFYFNIEALLIEIRDYLKRQCVTDGKDFAAGPALRVIAAS